MRASLAQPSTNWPLLWRLSNSCASNPSSHWSCSSKSRRKRSEPDPSAGEGAPAVSEWKRGLPERDGYISAVPCWLDVSEADAWAAVDLCRALFGWEFEDVMPPGSEGAYFSGSRPLAGTWALFGRTMRPNGAHVARRTTAAPE